MKSGAIRRDPQGQNGGNYAWQLRPAFSGLASRTISQAAAPQSEGATQIGVLMPAS